MGKLAAAIRQALDREGAKSLNERTKVPRATLYTLASGKTPSLKTLRRLKASGFPIPRDLLDAA